MYEPRTDVAQKVMHGRQELYIFARRAGNLTQKEYHLELVMQQKF